MAQTEPLNVELLDDCMNEVKARLAADPALTSGAADSTLLELRLARAVLEGAQIFGEDTARIIAFALDTLPSHRAGGASATMDGHSPTPPSRGARPTLLPV